MKYLSRLLQFLQPNTKQILLSILFATLTIAASIGLLMTSAYLISKAALRPSIGAISVAIVGVRFFGISRGIFRYIERLASHTASFKILADIRVWLYDAIEPIAPAGISKYKSGDLLNRLIADVDTLENFYVRVFLPPVVAIIIVLGVSAIMLTFSAWISLILFLSLVFVGIGLSLFALIGGKKVGAESVNKRSVLREDIVDMVNGLPEILLFTRTKQMIQKIQQAGREYYQTQIKISALNATQTAATSLIVGVAVWLVLLVSIPMVSSGALDGIYLAVIVLGVMASFEAVQNIPQAMNLLGANIRSAERIFGVTDQAALLATPYNDHALPEKPSIQLKGVSFRYAETPVLENIDIDLTYGKKIAIVGPSGAGKTTLSDLLLRFWDPAGGEILIDSTPSKQISPDANRELYSVVSQNSFLFNTSLMENLLVADPDASEEQVEHACKLAELDRFIKTLPKGYQTIIGERGYQFSGGERQRLAIARALLKNAPILILDEPTANLDPTTEKKIIATIKERFSDRSMLWITHRLTGLEDMDEIIVLSDGKIVERGDQASLLAAGGRFARMWAAEYF